MLLHIYRNYEMFSWVCWKAKKETTSLFSQIYQGLDGLILSQSKNKQVEIPHLIPLNL